MYARWGKIKYGGWKVLGVKRTEILQSVVQEDLAEKVIFEQRPRRGQDRWDMMK